MPYLLILRRDQTLPLGMEESEMFRRFAAWTRALQDGGSLLSVERLMPAGDAVTLSMIDGTVSVGGRYGTGEDVIGYYLLDIDDGEGAQQAATDCPILAVGGSVEIRKTQIFDP